MIKKLSLVGSARIVSTACQAVTLLAIARNLSPPEFAEFAAVLGGLMALNIISDGGATYAVGRYHESAAMTVQILRAGRLLSVATMAISVPVLGTLAYVSHSSILFGCLLLCAWVPLERQLEVNSAYLLAKNHEYSVGGSYLLRRVPTLVVILALPSTISIVSAFSVTMLLTAFFSSLMLARRVAAETSVATRFDGAARARFRAGWTRQLLPDPGTWSVLRPFWAAIAGQGIRQFDVAVLTFAAGTAVAGLFAPASRLVPALLLVPGTYTQMLLARLAATREELTARPLLIVGGVTTAAFVPLAVTASYWIPLLLGDAYVSSVDVVRIVTISLILATISSVFASGLHASDCASRVAAGVWISAGTTLVLVAILGSMHGAVGAAWAVALGYLLQFVMMAALYRFRPTSMPVHAS